MYKSNVKKFRFRSSTEVLFRKKHLQIVFATGTLSLHHYRYLYQVLKKV